MDNITELSNEIQREKIAKAREMTPTEKVLAGEELFHMASKVTIAGIKAQQPDLTDEQALAVLKDRLDRKQRMERSRA